MKQNLKVCGVDLRDLYDDDVEELIVNLIEEARSLCGLHHINWLEMVERSRY